MNRTCEYCKWWYKATCNCKEFNNNISITENDSRYIDYIEEGYFHENVRENIDIKELGKYFIKQLIEQDYIKKNKILNKANFEPEENDIYEYIEGELYGSIQNYFRGSAGADLKIKNPETFSCCYWE